MSKLVRDNILHILDDKGVTYTSHIADDAEYEAALFAKILEEATELADDKNLEEVADLSEVLTALMIHKGWTAAELEKVQRQKRIARGAFKERIILETSND